MRGSLVHFWRDTSRPDRAWSEAETPITTRATGPGCIIQSNAGSPGNFEVVVPEEDGLAHYWADNASGARWFGPTLVAPGSTGPGTRRPRWPDADTTAPAPPTWPWYADGMARDV